jgi:hypothetical protein
MGRHYEQYVISGYLPTYTAVRDIYSTSIPAANATSKTRAPAVTGNIGESIAALVARRKFKSRLTDIQPLVVANRKKTPDFRIRFRPMFPQVFRTATGFTTTVNFNYWPVESKAAASLGAGDNAVEKALLQLGTYWRERASVEPAVVGFGIVVCFVYRGTKANPLRCIRVHVITPNNQQGLLHEIASSLATTSSPDFVSEIGRSGSLVRGYLNGID